MAEDISRQVISPESEIIVKRITDYLYNGVSAGVDEIRATADELLAAAERENSDLLYGWYYLAMLEYINLKDDFTKLELYANEGLKYQERAGAYNLMIRSHIYLGISAEKTGDIEREVEQMLRGLDIALAHDLHFECCMVANNLSALFYREQEYERAIYYGRLCEDRMLKSGQWNMDMPIYSYFIVNLGNALTAAGRLDEAEQERAKLRAYLKYMEEKGRKAPDFIIYTFFAFLDLKQGDRDAMRADIDRALADKVSTRQCYMYLDDINIHLDVLEQAEEYDRELETIEFFVGECRKEGVDPSAIKSFFRRKAVVSYAKGDKDGALDGCREYMEAILSEEEQQARKIHRAEKRHLELKAEEQRRKLIQDKNEQLQADMETVRTEAAAKAAFISSVSHEIRTPINAILGMDEMILRETSEENIRHYAYTLRRAGKSLLGMINDILDYSKLDAGRLSIVPQEYYLADMINGSVDMIRSKAASKQLELKVDVRESIPRRLFGDDIRIKQIVTNLLSNAVKYTDSGSVSLNVDWSLQPDGNILLIVRVSDTGCGISEEDMSHIFDPFRRLEEDRNRNVEGTGLGLSIVQGLLKSMDSELKVESVYGEGSTFSFEVYQEVRDTTPVGRIDPNSIADEMENDRREQFTAKRASVLIVDDNVINLEVARGLLKRTLMRIETAGSGEEGLRRCRQRRFDIILMDHRMPGMSGIEALHRIREECPANAETPVIAMTANIESGLEEFYAGEGFAGYLTKPVSAGTLEGMIRKNLPDRLIDRPEDPALVLDEAAGIEACSERDIFLTIVASFVKTASDMAAELRGYLEKEDVEGYTVKVHALKSSARFVGATGLSTEAAYLEQCGKENRWEEILSGTGPMLEHLEKVAAKLGMKY